MKIVFISDTHNRQIQLPEGDLLVHCGDATSQGTEKEIIKFNSWLGEIKNNYPSGIIFSPGNHDWLFETNPALAKNLLSNATTLINEEIVINGHKIYCSPVQPEFCNWAFNKRRGLQIKQYWDNIPADTKILVTHGPPQGILDMCPNGDKVGCKDLMEAVLRIKPEYHVFGHIHHSYGMQNFNGTTFINAAICDEQYYARNQPFVIEL